jgi:hypothetical protein
VIVPRRHRRPLVLYVIGLASHDLNPFAPAKAIIMIVDLEVRALSARQGAQLIQWDWHAGDNQRFWL